MSRPMRKSSFISTTSKVLVNDTTGRRSTGTCIHTCRLIVPMRSVRISAEKPAMTCTPLGRATGRWNCSTALRLMQLRSAPVSNMTSVKRTLWLSISFTVMNASRWVGDDSKARSVGVSSAGAYAARWFVDVCDDRWSTLAVESTRRAAVGAVELYPVDRCGGRGRKCACAWVVCLPPHVSHLGTKLSMCCSLV